MKVRWLAALVSTIVMGVLFAVASPSYASTLGDLTVTPANGNDSSVVVITTSGPCPREATNVIATITGSGFESGQNLIGNSPLRIYPRTTKGGYIIPLQYTFGDVAKLQRVYKGLTGSYKVVATCRGVIKPTDLGQFTGTVSFSNKVGAGGYRNYVAKNPATAPVPTQGTLNGQTKGSGSSASQPVQTPQGLSPSTNGDGTDSAGSNSDSGIGRELVFVGLAIILMLAAALYVRRSQSAKRS